MTNTAERLTFIAIIVSQALLLVIVAAGYVMKRAEIVILKDELMKLESEADARVMEIGNCKAGQEKIMQLGERLSSTLAATSAALMECRRNQ